MADQKDHYSGHGGGAGAIRLYHDEAAGYYTEAQAILDYLLGRPAGEVIAHIQTLQQAKQIARAPK